MDLQQTINAHMALSRKNTLSNSDQLTLGELILKFEAVPNSNAIVRYDFGYLCPTNINSWRGAYDELALNYEENNAILNVSDILSILKSSIGKTFQGYKGGDYKMNKNTPIWVANYGEACNTAVIDIINLDYIVIIITAYREY